VSPPTASTGPKWQKLKAETGDTYYFNAATNESVWDRPSDYDGPAEEVSAPPPTASTNAWQKMTTDGGDVYFYNAETGESSWDPPPGFA